MCRELDQTCRQDRRDLLRASAALAALAALPGAAQQGSRSTAPPTRVLDRTRSAHGVVQIEHNGAPFIDAYMARPPLEGRHPAVVVIAGNLITEEYIPNTCAALADAGYVALAPNLYHVVPAGAQGNQEIAAASSKHDEEDVVLDMLAGLAHLRRQQFVDGSRIAALGFCFGGRIALKLATRSRDLCAVVAFHPAPRLERADVRGMRVPVQIHSGIIDRAAPPEVIRELGRHLAAEGAPHEVHLYEGADHGFLAYTRPHRYNAGAGMQAWDRTTTFLGRHLAPPNRS